MRDRPWQLPWCPLEGALPSPRLRFPSGGGRGHGTEPQKPGWTRETSSGLRQQHLGEPPGCSPGRCPSADLLALCRGTGPRALRTASRPRQLASLCSSHLERRGKGTACSVKQRASPRASSGLGARPAPAAGASHGCCAQQRCSRQEGGAEQAPSCSPLLQGAPNSSLTA